MTTSPCRDKSLRVTFVPRISCRSHFDEMHLIGLATTERIRLLNLCRPTGGGIRAYRHRIAAIRLLRGLSGFDK